MRGAVRRGPVDREAARPPCAAGDGRRLELLLLTDFDRPTASTVRDHVDSFGAFSRHRIRRLGLLVDLPPRIDLSRFDGVVIHYTLVACSDDLLSPAARAKIRGFRGLKAMFIQDEYRFVDRTIAAIRDLGIDLLFTCVPESEIDKVYSPQALPGVVKVNVLTGYVPPRLPGRSVPPIWARPVDIGYRGRNLPAHLGRLAQEKRWIGERVAADAPAYGLVTDISCREEHRIYGERWIEFVSRCKAVLGTESGANVFDFTGEIERRVAAHLAAKPGASFEEIERACLAGEEGEIRLNQISPRCFEAAALRTLMILYEGEYSGVLRPWRHYVPLRKDHANMSEVVDVLRDPARAAEIIERAYCEIALDPRYSYAHAVAQFDDAVDAVFRPEMLAREPAYSTLRFHADRVVNFAKWRRHLVLTIERAARWLLVRVALGWLSEQRREEVRDRIRRWRGIKAAGGP
jgi:hypothetical protein